MEIEVVDADIERAHRLNYRVRGCRPIIIKLLSFKKKEEILAERGKLKGTEIYIRKDFTKRVMEKRKYLQVEEFQIEDEIVGQIEEFRKDIRSESTHMPLIIKLKNKQAQSGDISEFRQGEGVGGKYIRKYRWTGEREERFLDIISDDLTKLLIKQVQVNIKQRDVDAAASYFTHCIRSGARYA